MTNEDQDGERAMYEELLRETPGSSAENVRRELLDGDIDVSLRATVRATIDDTTFGEAVTVAAIMPTAYCQIVTTFAVGNPGEALKAAVLDGEPRLIVGKLLVGDGGGDLLAVHAIFAADVRAE